MSIWVRGFQLGVVLNPQLMEAMRTARHLLLKTSWVSPRKINMEHNNEGLEDHFPF